MCMKQNLTVYKQLQNLKTFSHSAEASDSHFTGFDRTEIHSKNECWHINQQGDKSLSLKRANSGGKHY